MSKKIPSIKEMGNKNNKELREFLYGLYKLEYRLNPILFENTKFYIIRTLMDRHIRFGLKSKLVNMLSEGCRAYGHLGEFVTYEEAMKDPNLLCMEDISVFNHLIKAKEVPELEVKDTTLDLIDGWLSINGEEVND